MFLSSVPNDATETTLADKVSTIRYRRRRQTLKLLAAFSFVRTDDHAAGLWKYNCVVFAAAEARVQEKKNQLILKKKFILLSWLFLSPSFFILVWIFGSTSVCQGFVLKAIVHSSRYLQATLVEHEMTYFSPVLATYDWIDEKILPR